MPPLLRFLLAVCLLAGVRVAVADDGDAEHWRALARDDLEFIHKTLVEAHPGAIDNANPAFGRWMEEGYRESLALLPHVHDYGTFLNAVRAYVTGFRDGHLGVSDDGRRADVLVASKGFGVGLRHDRYVVTAVAANWPAPLPPVGARLLACDGRAPQDIIAEDVAPYRDRRDLASSRKQIAALLGEPSVSMGGRLRTCTFAGDDGRTLALDLVYRNVPFAEWAPLMNSGTRPVAPTNGYDLRDGLLWIRAQNFQPDREQYAALEAMLRELRQIKGAQSIVFDVRHNGGGNSAVGDMIFDAATGGLRFDRDGIRKLPPVYAEWRVSDVSIESAKARLADALRVYGHASDETAWLREHLRSLLVARAEGRRFVRQDTGEHRVTRADVARRHGRLRNFTGRIAVLTDDSCASACLDFVDEVRLVPGSLHLGATTSADSVYIDVGIVALPSGNRLMMPLKVWRNRLRGDNEPYVPDVAFDGDLDDDAAVRAFVVDALARHAKASDMR